MPNEMSGTMSLTLLVISLYLCGVLARRAGRIKAHATLMSLGLLGDLALTVYLVVQIHVFGQFSEPRAYTGALALLVVHTVAAVALLVGYGGTIWYAFYFLPISLGWRPDNAENVHTRVRTRHRAWGRFALVTYCATLILIPSGGPIAWVLKHMLS